MSHRAQPVSAFFLFIISYASDSPQGPLPLAGTSRLRHIHLISAGTCCLTTGISPKEGQHYGPYNAKHAVVLHPRRTWGPLLMDRAGASLMVRGLTVSQPLPAPKLSQKQAKGPRPEPGGKGPPACHQIDFAVKTTDREEPPGCPVGGPPNTQARELRVLPKTELAGNAAGRKTDRQTARQPGPRALLSAVGASIERRGLILGQQMLEGDRGDATSDSPLPASLRRARRDPTRPRRE
ncbi:hypothetical protein AAY473_032910 [Plecturocebus cupreus]